MCGMATKSDTLENKSLDPGKNENKSGGEPETVDDTTPAPSAPPAAPPAPNQSATVRVKLAHPLRAHSVLSGGENRKVGDVITVGADQAALLIRSGRANPVN